jgi:hypothetical protein
MSKLTEYLKLLPKAASNGLSIIEAIYKSIQLEKGNIPEEEREEILRRRLICLSCPFNSTNAQNSTEYREVTGKNYSTDRTDFHCSMCGCPIEYRTAALDKNCGIEDYNEEHPDNTLPLKWTKYGE